MSNIEKILGDFDPERSICYLPPLVTKRLAYAAFVHDMKQLQNDHILIPSERYFRQIWKEKFSHMKCVQYNRLGVCDLCVEYELKIRNSKNDDE